MIDFLLVLSKIPRLLNSIIHFAQPGFVMIAGCGRFGVLAFGVWSFLSVAILTCTDSSGVGNASAQIVLCLHHDSKILYTIDISRYNMTRHCTHHNKFAGKTLVRLETRERQPYLALTGELWESFVSYLEKIDRDILGAHYIAVDMYSSKPWKHWCTNQRWVGVHRVKQCHRTMSVSRNSMQRCVLSISIKRP